MLYNLFSISLGTWGLDLWISQCSGRPSIPTWAIGPEDQLAPRKKSSSLTNAYSCDGAFDDGTSKRCYPITNVGSSGFEVKSEQQLTLFISFLKQYVLGFCS